MSNSTNKPLNVLAKFVNTNVTIKLKNNIEYSGKMINIDQYMNIMLDNAEEKEGNAKARYGRIIIRGNNMIYIKLENKLT